MFCSPHHRRMKDELDMHATSSEAKKTTKEEKKTPVALDECICYAS